MCVCVLCVCVCCVCVLCVCVVCVLCVCCVCVRCVCALCVCALCVCALCVCALCVCVRCVCVRCVCVCVVCVCVVCVCVVCVCVVCVCVVCVCALCVCALCVCVRCVCVRCVCVCVVCVCALCVCVRCVCVCALCVCVCVRALCVRALCVCALCVCALCVCVVWCVCVWCVCVCVCVCPKSSLEKGDQAAIFLPHLMFSHLGEHYPNFFHEAFSLGKGKLEDFWKGVAATGDDRLAGHPMCLEKHWKQKTIPLFLRGDGVEFQTRDSLLVFSWGNFLGNTNAMKQHLLLASYPKSATSKDTWPPIWKWLKWSFTALGKGLHPTVDPDGKPLEKGSIFYKLQGTSLHPQGYRACLWAVLGDHEFFSNVLKLPHWSSHYPCWECDAQNFEGCEPTKYFKEIDLEKSNFEIASHASSLAEPRNDHPVFQLPHVSSKMVRGDPPHILFSKGLYSHLMGSILHYACWWEGAGKACLEGLGKG